MKLFDEHVTELTGFSPKKEPWKYLGLWCSAMLFMLFVFTEYFRGKNMGLFVLETWMAALFFGIPFFYAGYAAANCIILIMTTKKQ